MTGVCPINTLQEKGNQMSRIAAHGPVMEGERIAMWTGEFAADPHTLYERARARFGDLVPVELVPGIRATLVIGYQTALRILRDPDHFPADPRAWQQTMPKDCPARPMLEWRANALRNSGYLHTRYREATIAALAVVDTFRLPKTIERIAIQLISFFCEVGRADLLTEYAYPLVAQTINEMLGCTTEIGRRLAAGTAAMFDAQADSVEGTQMLTEALADLIKLKQREPGDDVTSALIAHPNALDEEELVQQLVTIACGVIEGQVSFITTTLLDLMVGTAFGDPLIRGETETRDALDEVLFHNPPLANLCVTYPRQPILIDDVWLPAHEPVVISIAACNTDPAAFGAGNLIGSRAHLAWSAGVHRCPAEHIAYLIAQVAIDQLVDALPEIRLDTTEGEPVWRPGPFHRSLTSLPVFFPSAPQRNLPAGML